MTNASFTLKDTIQQAFALARDDKPAYRDLFPLLEALFLLQAEVKGTLEPAPLEMASQAVAAKWESGFPLLRRWDFPVDIKAATRILQEIREHIPSGNERMRLAHEVLSAHLAGHPESAEEVWRSFLQHEMEPWEEWLDTEAVDVPSVLFLARSCLRPSVEWTAEDLLRRFPLPKDWLRGYCPTCGSLPALLFLVGEGERIAHCSWCGTQWGLQRLQCPYCDNRMHDSLGYMFVEAEPQYRIQHCNQCKTYFKLIDTRERLYPPFLPLEEWTTLHLDLLAQRAGWKQPASPSPVVYGEQ